MFDSKQAPAPDRLRRALVCSLAGGPALGHGAPLKSPRVPILAFHRLQARSRTA